MDERLILYGDAVLKNSHLLETGGMLYLYISDPDRPRLGDLFPLLNTPARTETIVAERNGESATFTGYNELMFIRNEGGGLITAGLRRG